jgi:hypothetical protein
VAANPDEKAKPRVPFSMLAKAFSNAVRVGFAALLYSKSGFMGFPGLVCTNVEV